MRTFIHSYRAIRGVPRSPYERLKDVVERWRSLTAPLPRRDHAPARATVTRLAPIVGGLRPMLRHARITGASVNIWKVAGLGRDERRNAEVLAWLLDPRGSHGMEAAPLRALFAALGERVPDLRAPEALERSVMRTEHRPMNSERDRVDLVIEHPAMLLFVEIKIDAGPGDQQLQRYADAAEQTATRLGCSQWRLVFLTVRRPPAVPDAVISLLWRDLAAALRRAPRTVIRDGHVSRSIDQRLNHFERF